jgi:hypothetical protein
MHILYIQGILNEADPVSRRPDFPPADNLCKLDESLWWDRNVPDIGTDGNDPSLLALSTLEILNMDDDFLSILKEIHRKKERKKEIPYERGHIKAINSSCGV